MSRIGKKPLVIPSGVTATLQGNVITVKGPKGTLSFTHPVEVGVKIEQALITVEKLSQSLQAQSIWGTVAKMISNLVEGVTKGFSKKLELNGVGYRMAVAGKKLNLALGFSHPVEVMLPDGIEAKVENNVLTLSGIDKQQIGEFAAHVRKLKPVEPYKGKGFRYVGEQVRKKEGKKAAA